jgi:nucleoside-diphosphate-sugar epimerase
MKRVLVTGHRGYIGAHLVDLLRQHGHYVKGVDIGFFDGCEWEPLVPSDEEIRCDVRALEAGDLDGCDCVMHLAAISNDPMGDLDPALTSAINRDASIRLARLAKSAGVPRFLFASSCSIYGKGARLDLDETAALNPVSAYARSKVQTEEALNGLADDRFLPVSLRNATAYGHSPMLRVDLVANNLLGCAVTKGTIRILSDGTPWRPLIHVRDIARAFVFMLEPPASRFDELSFNVGADIENYRVRDIAAIVKDLVPSAELRYTGEVGADPRDYRVSFGRLNRAFPEFRLEYDVRHGLEELLQKFRAHGFSAVDFDGPRFVRLRTLTERLRMAAE